MPTRRRNAKRTEEVPSLTASGRGKTEKLFPRSMFAIALAGTACFFIYIRLFSPPRAMPPPGPVPYIVDGQLEVLQWTPDMPFAESVAAAGKPVVLKNTVADKWRARKSWKPSYLKKKIKRLGGIYENENRWFGPYYDMRRPLVNLTQPVNSYETNMSMTGSELFERILSQDGNKFVYFSGEIERLGNWAINDITPFDELLVLNPHSSSVNVWIGQPHVIAHCHYDGYHNMYVQLYGKKKFTLFQPSQWSNLYPYPFLHPSHAQSQVNLSDADMERFPRVQQARAVEVVLVPGDVLYMPPLWFHHVEALEVSISVNVWTDSEQSVEVQKMYEAEIPILDEIPAEKRNLRVLVMISLIRRLVDETNKRQLTNNAQIFMRNLYDIRYHDLMVSRVFPSPHLMPWGDKSICIVLHDSRSELQTAFRDMNKLDMYLDLISNQIGRIPSDTRELWLGNFVESLLESVTTAPFVAHALNESLHCFHEL